MNKGFTLIEIIISIGILLVVLLPMMLMLVGEGGLGGALTVGRASSSLNKCAFLAEQTMNDHIGRLSTSFTSVASGTGGPWTYPGFDTERYCWSTTIREVLTEGGITNRLKVIRVLVWREEDAAVCTSPTREEMRYELNAKVCSRGETW